MEKKYNYFYRITNTINGNFYYGIHSTNNLEDGYMGSGHRLQTAIKMFGIENFTKEVIKFFTTRKELAEYEAKFVTENLVENRDCYNAIPGGEGFNTIGYTACYDKELQTNRLVTIKDYRENPERYASVHSGFVSVKNKKTGEWVRIRKEEYLNKKTEYIGPNFGKAVVKDKNGKVFLVDRDSPDLKSGKYSYVSTGRKHTKETKEKMRKTHIENGLQSGEKNSNFGKKWMHIFKKDGEVICKPFPKEMVQEKEKEGWVLGRIITKKIKRKDTIISKLNIKEITKDYFSGEKLKVLAEKYGISPSYVSKIARGLRKQNI